MAKTGFGKLERDVISNDSLPNDVRMAIANFKNQIKTQQGLVVFHNHEEGLPMAAAGQTYYEYQVGMARAATPRDPHARGKRRLVGLVDAGFNLLQLYFTDAHYTAGEWKQLQYP